MQALLKHRKETLQFTESTWESPMLLIFKGQTYANLEFWAFFLPELLSLGILREQSLVVYGKGDVSIPDKSCFMWGRFSQRFLAPTSAPLSQEGETRAPSSNQAPLNCDSLKIQWHNDTVGAILSWTSPPQQAWGRWVAGVNQRQLLQIECHLRNAKAWIKTLTTYREGSSGEQVIHSLNFISSLTCRKSSGFSEFHLPLEPHRNDGSESLGWKALWEQPPSVETFWEVTSFLSQDFFSFSTNFLNNHSLQNTFFKTKTCWNINATEK